jgi:hypothetical protein
MLSSAMSARRARAWWGIVGTATAVLASVLVTGCYDGFDPLDPEVLAEVARTRGDAVGFERSGIYVGTFDVLECGCSGLDAQINVTLCTLIELQEQVGGTALADIEIVQADGTVRITALQFDGGFDASGPLLPVFYGPLQADGRVSAAGVLQADAIAVQGQVLGRVDGVVEREDDTWVFVAELQQRYAVDLLSGQDFLDIGLEGGEIQSVDCRERIALDVRWQTPPYVPIDG